MITGFDSAFVALIGSEGAYSNNPKDPGAETMYGVTKRVALANGYTGEMKNLTLDQAKTIAKLEYWDKYDCDQFSPNVAFHVFDAAYNGGHPIQWLQTVVGVTIDGVMGPATVGAVRAGNDDAIIRKFGALRMLYLCDLVTWPAFGKGWMRRLANNQLMT